MKTNIPEEPETEALMQEGVSQVLELAQENGVTLDFSDDSINEVEKMLAECHAEYKKAKSEEGFYGLGVMFGAYIGEVIKRKGLGGNWARNHPDMGEDSFPFYWRGHALFLCAWCHKRIFDGDGDNVAFKYKCSVLERINTS
ncbi:MAG TPA: hypothetical protein VFB72_18155 [Verrucomicrobiae bacterium]|nr:hypothetical protein [Verrucomicrobiae bacterium]